MVVDAILWVTRTGCQWRSIDSQYKAKLPIILYYYYNWQRNGGWEKVVESLTQQARELMDDESSPSRVALDSQTVKTVPFVSTAVGIDGHKRINGRKRHIVVDKHGLLLAVGVSAANCHDGQEGIELLWKLEQFKRLDLFCLDKAYQGEFLEALELYGWRAEIEQKPESQTGFVPQKGRWQVERSFAWLNFYRRLSKDYEKTVASAACFIQIAFINMILAKISRLKS